MNWEESKKLQNEEFEFLDTIDIKQYIPKTKEIDVWNLMQTIENNHGKDYREPFIFNLIDEDEFIDYLKKRYGNISSRESITNYIEFYE